MCNPRPRKKAGTVSQLGILWVRKSTNAATNVTPMVKTQMMYCAFIGKDGLQGLVVTPTRPALQIAKFHDAAALRGSYVGVVKLPATLATTPWQ